MTPAAPAQSYSYDVERSTLETKIKQANHELCRVLPGFNETFNNPSLRYEAKDHKAKAEAEFSKAFSLHEFTRDIHQYIASHKQLSIISGEKPHLTVQDLVVCTMSYIETTNPTCKLSPERLSEFAHNHEGLEALLTSVNNTSPTQNTHAATGAIVQDVARALQQELRSDPLGHIVDPLRPYAKKIITSRQEMSFLLQHIFQQQTIPRLQTQMKKFNDSK